MEIDVLNLYDRLKGCPLFDGIARTDFDALLSYAHARMRTFEEGEAIAGTSEDRAHQTVGIIARGAAVLYAHDEKKHSYELERYTVGDVVANGFFYLADIGSDLQLMAKEVLSIVGLDADRLYETRSNSGAHLEQTRARFVSNMAKAIADQQKEMLRHLSILATRTTQEKILRFLYAYAHDTSSLSFTLPFSRQQMADYLCVDRSAMCTELYKLRAQGKLKVNMRHFELPPQSA